MSAADNMRAAVLAALEKSARENATRFRMGDGWMKSDEQAVRYGPLTPTISSHIDDYITGAQLRRALSAEVEAGRVLRQQDRPGGMIRFWPVGLFDKLQAERAELERIEKHVLDSISDLIGQKPSIEQVTQRVDAALQKLAAPQFTIEGVDLYDAEDNKFASLTPVDLKGGAAC